MNVWNVPLRRRCLIVRVEEVRQRTLERMVIIDETGKQHELFQREFTYSEWENIGAGSIIILTLSESVTGWRAQVPKVKSVQELVVEAGKKASGNFFIWSCEHCGTTGYVEYEEGDDPQRIAERVILAHSKEVLPDCKKDIRVFDHRGIEQKDSALFVSSRRVA